MEEEKKVRRSQQQRSLNEEEIRTAARMRNKFASVYSARALKK
jgi:hypothetical protein